MSRLSKDDDNDHIDSDYNLIGDHANAQDACFSHCTKTTSCGGYFPNYTWKSKFDRTLSFLSGCIVFLLFFGTVFPLLLYNIIDEGINQSVVIDSTDALSYDTWQTNFNSDSDDQVDVNYDVYLFDVQNINGLLSGEKPIVVERGPYAYHEYFNKFDISWSKGGDEVTYTTQKFFVFNPERTAPGLTENDNITLPYTTLVGFEYLLQEIPQSDQEQFTLAITSKIDGGLTNVSLKIEDAIAQLERIPPPRPPDLQLKLDTLIALDAAILTLDEGLVNYFNSSSLGSSLLKLLICATQPTLTDAAGNSVSGLITPFWTTTPVQAYFGWLNDTILVEVANLLKAAGADQYTIDHWSTAVPGCANNYTSEADAKRRKGPDTFRTGKASGKEVGQYVRYMNMTSQWVCLFPMDSVDFKDFKPGYEFPSCAHFQYDWTEAEIEKAGYVRAWATDYANRIDGNDGTLIGRPVSSDLIQMYVSDIYRTAYLEKSDIVFDWYNVELFRYTLQQKDLQNATLNPSEGPWYYAFGPSGTENLTAAVGIPLFVSKPHFLDASTVLQASVYGMRPSRPSHDTYLDIEPRSGALARAHKRLQINYQMKSMSFPSVSHETVVAAELICTNISTLDPDISCNGLDFLMQCLEIPTEWKMYNDEVYFPYAWADEWVIMEDSVATGIKDDIYGGEWLATTVNMYCYVCAGLLFSAIVGMLIARRILAEEADDAKFKSVHA